VSAVLNPFPCCSATLLEAAVFGRLFGSEIQH